MLSPGTTIGRYVVKRRLAEGGMAEVYLAQALGAEGFSKEVVIKVVRSFLSSDQQFIDMFIAEARLSSKLNHANVVQIFDFGKHDHSYYLAMEYVRGTSLFDLRRRCRERGVPFPPTLVAEIGAQVARGMQYAHTLSDKGRPLGIVHRDVTPHNVLLSYDGAVKLTDFGIAKASTTHTAPGVLKGKFAYMSPEQARGDVVDARTDIFALGVVLWEMLTGSRLFDGDSELAVLRAVAESFIAPPSRLNPDVPQELSDIVLKALTREPAGRFQTAFDFDRALGTFVLRAAKSVEDTSVSLFLQQLYREEIEAEERAAQTPAATPAAQRGVVPQVSSFGFKDTLSVDRSDELAQQRSTVDSLPTLESSVSTSKTDPLMKEGTGKTDQLHALNSSPSARTDQHRSVQTGSPKTDQMPALKPSRPLPPPAESTDVLRQPERKTEPQLDPVVSERRIDRDSGRVKVSDSIKLEMQRGEVAPQPIVDPTLVRIREANPPVEEPSGPTISPNPEQRTGRSSMMLIAVIIALAGGIGGGVLLFGGDQADDDGAPLKVSVPQPVAVIEPPKPLEPVVTPPPAVPTTIIDAGAAVDAGADLDAGAAVKPAPPTPVVAAPALVDAGVVAANEPKPTAPAVRLGTILVKAVPFATVIVDGSKRTEVVGTQKVKVPFGKHKVTFVHPRRSETFELTIDGKTIPELNFNANQ